MLHVSLLCCITERSRFQSCVHEKTFVMHIHHCCHGIAHWKQAGKLKPECWRERGGTAQSHKLGVQWALFFFCLFMRADLWYLMSQPVIQSPACESCSSFTHCSGLSGSIAMPWQSLLMLFQVLFCPSIQQYCRQLLFPFFSPKAFLVLVLPWIKHLIWNNLEIPLWRSCWRHAVREESSAGLSQCGADFPQLQNSGQVG